MDRPVPLATPLGESGQFAIEVHRTAVAVEGELLRLAGPAVLGLEHVDVGALASAGHPKPFDVELIDPEPRRVTHDEIRRQVGWRVDDDEWNGTVGKPLRTALCPHPLDLQRVTAARQRDRVDTELLASLFRFDADPLASDDDAAGGLGRDLDFALHRDRRSPADDLARLDAHGVSKALRHLC